jgi:hypothetical protein
MRNRGPNAREAFKRRLVQVLQNSPWSPQTDEDTPFEHLRQLLTNVDEPWLDGESPLGFLIAEAFQAPDIVDEELLPNQRPPLLRLRQAVADVDDREVEGIFNRGPISAELIVTKNDILEWVDEALRSWPDSGGRPEKLRERAIVARMAEAFQGYSGWEPADEELTAEERTAYEQEYLTTLLLFVAVLCDATDTDIPSSRDRLLDYVPEPLRRPK